MRKDKKMIAIITSGSVVALGGLAALAYFVVPYPGHGGMSLHEIKKVNNELLYNLENLSEENIEEDKDISE